MRTLLLYTVSCIWTLAVAQDSKRLIPTVLNENQLKASRVTQNSENAQVQAFRSCLLQSGTPSGKLVSRDLNSANYNLLNRQWNLRKQKVYPLAYILPTHAQDVSRAVKCGLKSRLHLIPNSGGHSYEAIGWGTNSTVVVDFRNMKNISIEGSGSAAVGRLEPGALVGPVNAYFWANGGYATPMGNCLTVGMGGHATGGGVGFYSTLYGLMIDNIVEYEGVDGHGNIVVANEKRNSDLFWTWRGSGPGYIGIVTSVKVKLFEASRINITLVRLRYALRDFATSFIAYQNMLKWIQANEPSIFLMFSLVSDNYTSASLPLSPGVEYNAVHIQDPNVQPHGNASFLKAIYEIFPQGAIETMQLYPNYIQFVAFTGYAPILNQTAATLSQVVDTSTTVAHMRDTPLPTTPVLLAYLSSMRKELAIPRYFKAKSFFIKRYFTLAQIVRLAVLIQKIPPTNIWILCNSEQGRIHVPKKSDMAYVHRDALLDITIHYEGSSDPDQVAVGMKYLYDLWEAIQFMDGGETYQNYPDLDVENHFVRNYGQNLGRLIQQKGKWDPKNYFLSPLSLPGIPGI